MDTLIGIDVYPEGLEDEVDKLNQNRQYAVSYHKCELVLIEWANGIEWFDDNGWYKEDGVDNLERLGLKKKSKGKGKAPESSERKAKKPSLRLMDLFSVAAFYTGNFHRAFHIQYKLLNSVYTNDEHTLNRMKFNIQFSIDKIKTRLDFYPEDVIDRLKARGNGTKGLVTLSMTTCKRIDLFKRTMNSFLNACKDIDLIDRFLIIDDQSSDEDCTEMKELYPFIELIRKKPEDKGHPISMNMIVDMVKTTYCLHLEDDHEFFCHRNYIKPSMRIMLENDDIRQVLFNENYAEIPNDIDRIGGGDIRKTKNGKKFKVHVHYPMGSSEYNQYMAQINKPSNTHWPHYSFRPALNKVDIWLQTGRFEKEREFERGFAYRYSSLGCKSAFLLGMHHIHIGRTSHDLKAGKEVKNAYILNDTRQWGY